MQTIVNMYRYSWLITFQIFPIFFFWIEGWVGGVNFIQFFLDFCIFLYLQGPLEGNSMH